MKLIYYIKESFDELVNRVTWISLLNAQKATIIVALFSLFFAILVFLTDEFFRNVLRVLFDFFISK